MNVYELVMDVKILYQIIDEWFEEQGGYYNGGTIDGIFDLEQLSAYIIEKWAELNEE